MILCIFSPCLHSLRRRKRDVWASVCLALILWAHLHRVTLVIRRIHPYLALLVALLVHFQLELELADHQPVELQPLQRVEAHSLDPKVAFQALLPLVLRTWEALDTALSVAFDPLYSQQR